MNWKEIFDYVPETGELVWRPRIGTPKKVNAFNLRFAGKVAGSERRAAGGNRSYTLIRLRPKDFYAHRVIWEMFNGPIPKGMEVDHIDCVATNNRIENLRICTPIQNRHNVGLSRRNTSGIKGVNYCKERGLWEAEVRSDRKRYKLGRFQTKGLAAAARAKKALQLHGEFFRFN